MNLNRVLVSLFGGYFFSFLSPAKSMGKTHFYALWSLHEAPRQCISNVSRTSYQLQIPLPLPKQLVVFSLGDWTSFSCGTTVLVEVFVSPDVKPQKIGILSPRSSCLVWEGDWTVSLLSESAMKSRRGGYATVLLTVCGEVKAGFVSSTPLVKRRRSAPSQSTSLSQTLLSSASTNNITSPRSSPEDTVSYAELTTSKEDIPSMRLRTSRVWSLEKNPSWTVIGKRGCSLSSEGSETQRRSSQGSNLKKRKLSIYTSQNVEREVVKMMRDCRAEHPSKRWNHTMCLCDPDTAVLVGGETADHNFCTDSIWKLEIDGDFWFPMNSSTVGPLPPSSQGHSAAFDPKNKVVYVYGGLREGQRYSDVYMLDTLTWKWKLIKSKGNVPSLAYHSCSIYKGELYVFGGLQPSRGPGGKTCSNALYIFNPEHELWYQPIVEGHRPLPRFGHSSTLLHDKIVIFGGQKTAAYLNDLHILDLGFMEYAAVKYENMPPLARGFHAALPMSDNRVLISGGCSALGALQDLYLFNIETSCWTSVVCPLLSSKPRAGHSLISLTGTAPSHTGERDRGDGQYTIVVFGGSDCIGTFYDDTVQCVMEIPDEGRGLHIKATCKIMVHY
ncbi:rab9 effector protein with kelch motifs isoform X3 [Neoarius graeffei]|uniref:rab9 effector protein with kelch motifs isoform X3 n=1 Tax=Neoarius graeffei TaxID=443677 RepID=UPI00298C8CA7|nr:rab9 effector protein with kelch motifs isoform X3 [Neoarius graeffei]